jgi:23S rRNA G2069 N7-methylase RlmK/C1962 C5-methylase RlmI
MDFRKMDLQDKAFKLVVFDPPHLFLGEKSYMAQSYGRLDKETWKSDLRKGFSECFRVLEDEGILIFKWNECDVPLKEVLSLHHISRCLAILQVKHRKPIGSAL